METSALVVSYGGSRIGILIGKLGSQWRKCILIDSLLPMSRGSLKKYVLMGFDSSSEIILAVLQCFNQEIIEAPVEHDHGHLGMVFFTVNFHKCYMPIVNISNNLIHLSSIEYVE